MKIKNFTIATVGAASLALALSACSETGGNNANNANIKPINTSTPAPVNTATPAPMNTNTNGGNANHNSAPMNSNTKPMNTNMNSNAKPAPTK